MITLPSYPPRQSWLKAFWLVVSLGTGLLTSVFLSLEGSPTWFVSGAVLALVMAAPGLKWPQIVSFPYRVWNKLAREFARLACLWLITVCFYIVVAAVGRAGSYFRLSRPAPNESLWMPRETGGPRFRGSIHGVVVEAENQSWAGAFLSWAAHSGNGWAWFLCPFVVFLSAFDTEEENGDVPANIYTLF